MAAGIVSWSQENSMPFWSIFGFDSQPVSDFLESCVETIHLCLFVFDSLAVHIMQIGLLQLAANASDGRC